MQATVTLNGTKQLILDVNDVSKMIRLSPSTINRKIGRNPKFADESFPKPIDLGTTKNYWRLSDLEKWIESRPQRTIEG